MSAEKNTISVDVALARISSLVTEFGMFAEVPVMDILFRVFPEGEVPEAPSEVQTLISKSSRRDEVALQFGNDRFLFYKWDEMVCVEGEGIFEVATNIPQFRLVTITDDCYLNVIGLDFVLNRFVSALQSLVYTKKIDMKDFARRFLHLPDLSLPLIGRDEDGNILVKFGSNTFGQGPDGLFMKVDKKWFAVSKRAFGEGLYL